MSIKYPEIQCIYCNSTNIIRKGIRKGKLKNIQAYFCKKCHKNFTLNPLKKTKYPIKIILNSISLYNLGHSRREVSKIIKRRFKVSVPERTISSWAAGFQEIFPFYRLRDEIIKKYPKKDMILSCKLHHQQVYKYQFHRGKLEMRSKDLPRNYFLSLKSYLESVPTRNFPHHFFRENGIFELKRASKIKILNLRAKKVRKNNISNNIAELGILLAKSNRERHLKIQNLILINDSATVATEVPVYLESNDLRYFNFLGQNNQINVKKHPIIGHIDLIQIRNNSINILDYKPESKKIDPTQQLFIYALSLSSRAKIPLRFFKCAWFDEKDYFEFNPKICFLEYKTQSSINSTRPEEIPFLKSAGSTTKTAKFSSLK